MRRLAPALLFAVLSSPALAQADSDLGAELKICADNTDDAARLKCYDALAAVPPSPSVAEASSSSVPAPPPAPTPVRNDWTVSFDKSKIDDSKAVYLAVFSAEPVPQRFGNGQNAQLTIRCLENTTALYIIFGGAFMASSEYDNYGDVTYRVDDRPAVKKGFNNSTDNQALGLWSGGVAIPMIKQLFGGTKLVVRAVPYNESQVELEFPISGLEDAVKPLRETCKW
jgi:type VI secretion system protein VasI